MPQHKMQVVDGVRYRPEHAPAATPEGTSADQQGADTGRTAAAQTRRRRSPTRRESHAGSAETPE